MSYLLTQLLQLFCYDFQFCFINVSETLLKQHSILKFADLKVGVSNKSNTWNYKGRKVAMQSNQDKILQSVPGFR